MKILTLPKGEGKTRTLAQLMADNSDLVYVAPDHHMAHNVYLSVSRRVPGIDRERFRSASNIQEYMRGRRMAHV